MVKIDKNGSNDLTIIRYGVTPELFPNATNKYFVEVQTVKGLNAVRALRDDLTFRFNGDTYDISGMVGNKLEGSK